MSKRLPTLLKTGAALALSCVALAHAPKAAQAQAKTVKAPLLSFGVPMFGPAPLSDVEHPDVCWAPGTPLAKIAAYEKQHPEDGVSVSPFRTLGQGRWTNTATSGAGLTQGQTTILTYSFVPDGTALPLDNREPSNLQARLNSIYGSKAAWLAVFARVGAALSAQSGLTYVYEPNDDGAAFANSSGELGVRGDIRISGHPLDGNSGVLGYNFSPNTGDMVLDTNDNFYENRGGDDLGIRNVVTHEFGHGVGLGHTCPINETKLMEPTVTGAFDGPQFDDIRGLQRFYGDSLEDNDTAATATNLGALNNGTTNAAPAKILSIDDTSDVDFFRFSTAANRSISIAVRPTGETYPEAGQSGTDPSCQTTPGTPLNPKIINDLGFELFQADAAGTFVSVATVNAAAIGETEVLAPTNFPSGGNFRVRVFGGSGTNVQTYTMDVTVGDPVVTPTPTPEGPGGPDPTPVPTPTAGPTPLPGPTPIRPIVDLNNLNADERNGEDSPNPSGIDNTAIYRYRYIAPDGAIVGQGGAQRITPPETIVLSDISSNPILPGAAIREARVRLSPDDSCGIDPNQPIIPAGIAPDNCNPQGKRDNEVLAVNADALRALNDNARQNLSAAYDVNSQILTITGGVRSNGEIRSAYERALQTVTYENKLPIAAPSPFTRTPNLTDRVITYVVDSDNDATNNRDGRFVPQDPGNPRQSKPATLTLRFVESQSLVVTTLSDNSTTTDRLTSLREAIQFANTIPANNGANPPVANPPSIITFAPSLANAQRPGTINLLSPLPIIAANTAVAIQGLGARILTVNGSGAGGSVFQNFSSTTISGLTITGGSNRGISNTATLTVDATTISGNGAGIASNGGNLRLTNSTISGNSGNGLDLNNAAPGADAAATTTILNSTISGNGNIGVNHAGSTVNTSLTTITNNATGYSVTGNSRAEINRTILSGNTRNDITANDGRNVISGGYNIVGTGNVANATTFNGMGDQVGVAGNAARLGILRNNGGPTDTHNLFPGSPAINNGGPTPANPPATDQRGTGFNRVAQEVIDVGAFERQNNDAVVNPRITVVNPRPGQDPRSPTTEQTITVDAGSDATNITYVFFVDGVQIDQDNRLNTLNLRIPGQGDRGQTILVRVTATNATNAAVTGTDSVVVANSPSTFTTRIVATNQAPNAGSNEALTNSVLTAVNTVTDLDNEGVNATYRWRLNGAIIPGETNRTLNLATAGNGDRGDVVSVEVTGTDPGGTPTVQTASVTVGNTPPVAQNVAFDVTPGQTVRIPLTATDADTKQATTANPNGVDRFFRFVLTTNPTKGTAAIEVDANGNSVLVYTSNADATGTDTFQFTATDTVTRQADGTLVVGADARTSPPATATATVPVVPGPTPTPGPTATPAPTPTPVPTATPVPDTNRPPAGSSFSVNTQREVPIVARIALSDPDFEDTYNTLNIIRLAGGLRKGTGGIRKDTDGVWKLFYKASRLYEGNDQVQYIVEDRKGARSAVATITINIFNTKPTARSTRMQVAAGGSANIPVFGQDADNDTLTFQRVGGPTKGTGELLRDANGVWRFYYQNDTAAVGNDQVRFIARDGKAGGDSEVATIEIVVVGVFNRAPSAQNVAGTTTKNTSVAVAVAGTDPDEDDVLTFKRVGGPTNGGGDIRRDTDGTFKMFYTPRTGFVGTETIRYVAVDQKGRPSAPATITITVANSSAASAVKSPAPSAGSS